MQVTRLVCKNFRCFDHLDLVFEEPCVLICGRNGVGKTSILEALYYGCYARSFRTAQVKNLLLLNADHFSVAISFTDDRLLSHELRSGFADNKKLIKIDQRPVRLYREITDHYRIITVTADDLSIIQGAPEIRRNFIDHTVFLLEPEYTQLLHEYHRIVLQKKSLLKNPKNDFDSYRVWTKKLWEYTKTIQKKRLNALLCIKEYTNKLLDHYQIGNTIDFSYKYKEAMADSFEEFSKQLHFWYQREKHFGRSLFGAHLDDIEILFQAKKTRTLASRGQQKLTIVFLKIALMNKLIETKGKAIFCIDDFLADFDDIAIKQLFSIILDLNCQVIITSPNSDLGKKCYVKKKELQEIKLTN